MNRILEPDKASFIHLATMKMPFGKYKGLRLVDLPEPYLVWFSQKGYPEGKLGKMLQSVYEIKLNGLEYLFNVRGDSNELSKNCQKENLRSKDHRRNR